LRQQIFPEERRTPTNYEDLEIETWF